MAQALGSLPVGALVKDLTTTYNGVPIVWRIVDKNHSGYPSGAITLMTDKIISMKCYDTKELRNKDTSKRIYGNNRYIHSNIRQWMNSTAAPGLWYTAQHEADEPPAINSASDYNKYAHEAGFLHGFSPNLRNLILTTTLTVAKDTLIDGDGSENFNNEIFIASTTEVGLANENYIAEGIKLAAFMSDASRQAYPTPESVRENGYTGVNISTSTSWHYWLRTPMINNRQLSAKFVNTFGKLGDGNACASDAWGIRPLCNVSPQCTVSDSMGADGVYLIMWNQPPSISDTDRHLGDRNADFALTYTVGDSDLGDLLTVTESLDGTICKIFNPMRGTTNSISVSVEGLSLGQHTVTVNVDDGKGGIASRTWTFNRTNAAPTISGGDLNLGDKNVAFTYSYTVADTDNDPLTVTEQLNGSTLRTLNNPPKGQPIQLEVGSALLYSLPLQSVNTITISANDGRGGVAYRQLTFRRSNSAPVISGTDADLGLMTDGFTKAYTITDIENDAVQVAEKLDDKQLRSYPATLGKQETVTIPRNTWLLLLNGMHILKVEATDSSGATSVRAFTFRKQETVILFQLSQPFETDVQASKIIVTPNWKIDGASARVEVCNNAFDPVPAWEDATVQTMINRVFNFTNTTKTASRWGINVRVRIEKQEGYTGEVSISSIGGAYE